MVARSAYQDNMAQRNSKSYPELLQQRVQQRETAFRRRSIAPPPTPPPHPVILSRSEESPVAPIALPRTAPLQSTPGDATAPSKTSGFSSDSCSTLSRVVPLVTLASRLHLLRSSGACSTLYRVEPNVT